MAGMNYSVIMCVVLVGLIAMNLFLFSLEIFNLLSNSKHRKLIEKHQAEMSDLNTTASTDGIIIELQKLMTRIEEVKKDRKSSHDIIAQFDQLKSSFQELVLASGARGDEMVDSMYTTATFHVGNCTTKRSSHCPVHLNAYAKEEVNGISSFGVCSTPTINERKGGDYLIDHYCTVDVDNSSNAIPLGTTLVANKNSFSCNCYGIVTANKTLNSAQITFNCNLYTVRCNTMTALTLWVLDLYWCVWYYVSTYWTWTPFVVGTIIAHFMHVYI